MSAAGAGVSLTGWLVEDQETDSEVDEGERIEERGCGGEDAGGRERIRTSVGEGGGRGGRARRGGVCDRSEKEREGEEGGGSTTSAASSIICPTHLTPSPLSLCLSTCLSVGLNKLATPATASITLNLHAHWKRVGPRVFTGFLVGLDKRLAHKIKHFYKSEHEIGVFLFKSRARGRHRVPRGPRGARSASGPGPRPHCQWPTGPVTIRILFPPLSPLRQSTHTPSYSYFILHANFVHRPPLLAYPDRHGQKSKLRLLLHGACSLHPSIHLSLSL